MKSYDICLSLSDLFHLALCPPSPSMLSQVARFHLWVAESYSIVWLCMCVCVKNHILAAPIYTCVCVCFEVISAPNMGFELMTLRPWVACCSSEPGRSHPLYKVNGCISLHSTNSVRGFPFLLILTTLISCLFDRIHSDSCEVMSYCGFLSHFLGD